MNKLTFGIAALVLISLPALGGFEYRPPRPAVVVASDVETPSATDPASTNAACEAGVTVGDGGEDLVLSAGSGSGWSSFVTGVGAGWTARGPAVSEPVHWSHSAEPLSLVLDALAKANGLCIWVWPHTKLLEIQRVSATPAHAVSPEVVVAGPVPAVSLPVAAPVPAITLPVAAASSTDAVDVPQEQTSSTVAGGQVTAAPELPLDTAPAAASVSPPWSMHAGETLRETFERWALVGKGSLVWEPAYDLRIEVAAEFDGSLTFEQVVEAVLRSYWRRGEKLRGRYFAANRVLLVSAEE